MSMGDLMARLSERLPFTFDADEINSRLESLISREYIERDASDPTQLSYLV